MGKNNITLLTKPTIEPTNLQYHFEENSHSTEKLIRQQMAERLWKCSPGPPFLVRIFAANFLHVLLADTYPVSTRTKRSDVLVSSTRVLLVQKASSFLRRVGKYHQADQANGRYRSERRRDPSATRLGIWTSIDGGITLSYAYSFHL